MEKSVSMITCYLGLTIVGREPLLRLNKYKERVCETFGYEHKPVKEAHITLIPPFSVDYEEASRINMGCALSTLLSTSSVNSSEFRMRGLSFMHFEGEDILHFPIKAFTNRRGEEEFVRRVHSLRKQLKALGIEYRQTLPNGYTPHITVLSQGRHASDKRMQAILKESRQEIPLQFRAQYPTLYAKYKDIGYADLTYDPNKPPLS